MSLELIQEEVRKWARHNFGSQPLNRIILGLAEEVGEIAECLISKYPNDHALHALRKFGLLMRTVLKSRQQIREHAESSEIDSVINAQIDAVIGGLSNWKNGIDLFPQVPERFPVHLEDGVADLGIYLLNFADEANLSLLRSITKVWSEVKQRDWKAYPKNGRTE